VQEGKVAPPPTAEELEDMSRAAFFSLRPMTERVTLVVDRSGSMSAPFGPDLKQSRYGMAIDQTINFLRVSGETTRFNVFLFSDATLRYKPRLQPADERNLEALRRWMEENGPGGGTHLKDAILEALELRRDGTVDVDRLESDTIIVLCDGDTIAGPDWVRGTVDAIRERARLVFHCVQIGDDGDGTLEQLAESTGGDFIHIAR
jgi:Mg-chelatase subunit ChlD